MDKIVVERQGQLVPKSTVDAALRKALAAKGVTGDLEFEIASRAYQLYVSETQAPTVSVDLAHFDPDTGDWVRSYLESYQKRVKATILLASHNMSEVERLCTHVLMMRKGQIVDRGSPAELIGRYGRDTLEQVFLDIARQQGLAAE